MSRRLTFGFLLLVLNSAYLVARAEATLFYFANVALHVALGLVVTNAGALFRIRYVFWILLIVIASNVFATRSTKKNTKIV